MQPTKKASPPEIKNTSGLIKKFKKNKSYSESGISLNLIKNSFENALEYKGIADGVRGLLMFISTVCLIFILYTVFDLARFSIRWPNDWAKHIGLLLYASIAIPFGVYFFLKNLRFEIFRPQDEPVIFDRKNRKVYRIFREVVPGWKGLLKRWPLRSAIYEWDLVDAEHHATVIANTSTVSRNHALVIIVRNSRTDPSIKDSFTIGSGQLGEVTVPAVYEHIRKFMEEDGPHMPPTEIISPVVHPSTIWQCLASVGPYGENFKTLWNDHKIWLAIIIIFYPLLFFIMTPIGIFSWISYKTAIPIRWSQEIMDAVGKPREFT
jgi:hypothetical protein